ncbi:GvpL/GvpF family gas vesicle protein [Streptomyces sp. NBC_01775]|uniref:GvpL/GvpF family gas vesicle protein n=1 Tax=Streptomyces sp. NBC_01775 TaxID=2975939 RepID=UPI002DDA5F58|nr:GvpL/GvpF family gas vesicle protein [Streptomyces sp. NBC_01775]WSB80243.1 GvpL/GvpF family gas vesicle protein [Streptomyces sp. NBC_01775]
MNSATSDDTRAELRYVYAVTAPLDGPLPEDLRGVGGTTPFTVEHAGLAAVVSLVPEADFAEEPLRAHLEDLDWLADTARAHQAVVDALTGLTCPLPLRLATVYHDEDGVRRALAEGREEFEATLRRLEGRVEWGVKVYASAPETPAAAPAAPASGGARGSGERPGPTSGRDYLRRRRHQVTARENALQEAEQLGRSLHSALSGQAEEVRVYPAQNPKLSKVPGQNLLNAAYLVPRERSEDFVSRVEQLGAHDPNVRVELTGPWAPYSFAAADRADERGHAGERDRTIERPAEEKTEGAAR